MALAVPVGLLLAEKLEMKVKIVDRQTHDTH
jgi:hypothetical protein